MGRNRNARSLLSIVLLVALISGSVALLPTIRVAAAPFTFAFSADKASIVNDGSDTATITVLITDDGDSGNPVPDGTAVEFIPNPASNPDVTFGTLTGTTTGGQFSVTVSSSAAIATVSQIDFQARLVTPDVTSANSFTLPVTQSKPVQANSTIVAAVATLPADGTTTTITVTLLNAASDPVPGVTLSLTPDVAGPTVTPPSIATDAAGQAVFTVGWLNTELAVTQAVVFTTNDIDGTAGNFTLNTSIDFTTPALASKGQSTVSAAPTSIVANGVDASTVTVTVRDAAGTVLPGKTVTLAAATPAGVVITPASTVTDGSGIATFTVTSTTVGNSDFTATVTTDSVVLDTDVVNIIFTAPAAIADKDASTVSAVPASIAANGVEASTVTVTVRDASNNPLPGKTVTLAAGTPGGVTITPASAVTNGSGVATFTVTSTSVGSSTFTATVTTDSVVLDTDVVTITFTTPPAITDKGASTVVAAPTSIVANGVDASTVTVTVRDASNNPLSGKLVTLTAGTPGGVTISPASATTNGSGVATFTVRSTAAGGSNFTATVITDAVVLDTDVVTITFTAPPAGGADPLQSTVTVDKTTVVANGVDGANITATIRDAAGTALPNKIVSLSVTGSTPTAGIIVNGDSVAPWNPTVTDGNGQAFFNVRSTIPYAVTIFYVNVDTDGVAILDAADLIAITFTSAATATPTATATGVGSTSPFNSTVSCNFTGAPANPAFITTMLVTLRDINNQPVPNHIVQPGISPQTAGIIITSPNNFLSDVNGNVTILISSSTQTAPSPVIFSVTDASSVPPVLLTQTCAIVFGPPDSTPIGAATPIGGLTPIGTLTPTRNPLLQPPSQGPIVGTVVAWRLRVRGGPGLEFPILGLLGYKTQVVLIARNVQGTWLQIQLDENNVAWVSSKWIRVSRVLFRRLPIIGGTASGSPVLKGVSGTPQPGQGVGQINTYLLRARTGPGLNYTQVGVLSLRTELLIVGISEDRQWYLVAVEGGTVWCFAAYVKVLSANGEFTTIPTPPYS